jgi:hypothetical protein
VDFFSEKSFSSWVVYPDMIVSLEIPYLVIDIMKEIPFYLYNEHAERLFGG